MTIETSGPIGGPTSNAMTLAELRQHIADFLARDDLTSYIDTFITLAEDWLNFGFDDMPALRVRDMETIDVMTPTDGACTISDDFLQHIRAVEKAASRRVLTYITPDAAESFYPARTAGLASQFTIIGSSLYTFPLALNDIELTYYAKLPKLVANETNWLLGKSPSLYLNASLAVAADFIKDAEEFQKRFLLTKSLVAGLNRSDVVGRYARAGVTIRGCTP